MSYSLSKQKSVILMALLAISLKSAIRSLINIGKWLSKMHSRQMKLNTAKMLWKQRTQYRNRSNCLYGKVNNFKNLFKKLSIIAAVSEIFYCNLSNKR